MEKSATNAPSVAEAAPQLNSRTLGWMVRAVMIGALLVPVGLTVPSEAVAEIYHYVDDDGHHHFTTYRMRGMELIDVVGGQESQPAPERRSRSRRSSRTRSYDHSAFDSIITEASERYDLPFEFIKAVIKAESAFNPRAVSRTGAQGLMQLMPRTAESLGVDDSFDPRQNIMGGTLYLRQLADRYDGDINLVLSGYNAGPGAVARNEGIPYEATRGYIQTVYRYYQEYLAESEQ